MTTRARQPAYKLTVAGQDITTAIRARLIDLTLTDNRGFESDQLDLTLDDSDGALDIPPRGAIIRLALGWAGASLEDKGTYTVDEVEHSGAPDRITIRARSADLRAGLSEKRDQSWHATTIGGIVKTIAGRNRLAEVIADELASKAIAHLDQTDESDANLLTRLAQDFDAIATVKAGRLLFTPAGQARTASGKPLQGVLITRSSGDSHRFSVADRNGATAVKANWYDVNNGIRDSVTVGAEETDEDPETTEPSTPNVKTLRHTYPSRQAAAQAAKAELQRLQRGVADFSITLAIGRPELIPELPAIVRGFKPQIDQANWIISRVTHRLGDAGLTTSLDLELLNKEQ